LDRELSHLNICSSGYDLVLKGLLAILVSLTLVIGCLGVDKLYTLALVDLGLFNDSNLELRVREINIVCLRWHLFRAWNVCRNSEVKLQFTITACDVVTDSLDVVV
jgi:hypothetical protein